MIVDRGEYFLFFFQAEDGIRDFHVTGVQTCALPICPASWKASTCPSRMSRSREKLACSACQWETGLLMEFLALPARIAPIRGPQFDPDQRKPMRLP